MAAFEVACVESPLLGLRAWGKDARCFSPRGVPCRGENCDRGYAMPEGLGTGAGEISIMPPCTVNGIGLFDSSQSIVASGSAG